MRYSGISGHKPEKVASKSKKGNKHLPENRFSGQIFKLKPVTNLRSSCHQISLLILNEFW